MKRVFVYEYLSGGGGALAAAEAVDAADAADAAEILHAHARQPSPRETADVTT